MENSAETEKKKGRNKIHNGFYYSCKILYPDNKASSKVFAQIFLTFPTRKYDPNDNKLTIHHFEETEDAVVFSGSLEHEINKQLDKILGDRIILNILRLLYVYFYKNVKNAPLSNEDICWFLYGSRVNTGAVQKKIEILNDAKIINISEHPIRVLGFRKNVDVFYNLNERPFIDTKLKKNKNILKYIKTPLVATDENLNTEARVNITRYTEFLNNKHSHKPYLRDTNKGIELDVTKFYAHKKKS
jgi:hypothetical protein